MRITRGELLKVAGAGTAWIALIGVAGCGKKTGQTQKTERLAAYSPAQRKSTQTFYSRPDLEPPNIKITTPAHDTSSGYIFVAPKTKDEKTPGDYGPMILDDHGQVLWFRSTGHNQAQDLKVQHYEGKPVLTWFEGKVVYKDAPGHGMGDYVILDDSYNEVTSVRAGNGYQGDLHDFLITPQGTALFTIYHPVSRDLSVVGGSPSGQVLDNIVQEVDIKTGRVLFEWHSLDYVTLEESYWKLPKSAHDLYDYFHINSIDVEDDGSLLVSGRHTSALYKIDRNTGGIIWRLGGKKSDFEMGKGTRTAYQHDARSHPDDTVSIFDNGSAGDNAKAHDYSRGVVLKLDTNKMTATLLHEYIHPDKILASSQGNVEELPNGNVFIGWGSEPYFSEYSKDGKLLFDARFPSDVASYRAFRNEWRGKPDGDPVLAVRSRSGGNATLYASWNGATEVDSWQVLAGASPDSLKPAGYASWEGFETAIKLQTADPYVLVKAKNRSGQVLGKSKATKIKA